jgi:hypothetical protein
MQTLYRIKLDSKEYRWPCEIYPERTIKVTKKDTFFKCEDGTLVKWNEPGGFGIMIPESDLEEIDIKMKGINYIREDVVPSEILKQIA